MCVCFQIKCEDINLNLPSRDCPTAGGGGGERKPNAKDEMILEEWRKMGFTDQDVKPEMVVSFWKFVKRKCG